MAFAGGSYRRPATSTLSCALRSAGPANVDRDMCWTTGWNELRRCDPIELTEWVRDFGQGCALTEAGRQAIVHQSLPPRVAVSSGREAGTGGGVTAYERGEIVRGAFLEPCTPYVSRILIAVNVLFFLGGAGYAWKNDLPVGDYFAGTPGTTVPVLMEMGALRLDLVFLRDPAQFQRIVLFFFLHIGLLHLFMNMYFLGTLGPLIEAMWGSVRFLAIYCIAGIVSGCVVLLMDYWLHRLSLTAGASGSLFGIFASFLVWFLFNQRFLPRDFVRAWSRNIGINLILLTAINFVPGVSWQGHLGGRGDRRGVSGGAGAARAAVFSLSPGADPGHSSRRRRYRSRFFPGLLWQVGWF